MAKKQNIQSADPVLDTLKDILIAQLGTAGVAQQEIRKIAGCDMKRVTRIVKAINKARKA